jgi:RimJ/RimL family protein N-acetyltransferase
MPATEVIRSERLTLSPLETSDATEMVGVLSDPTLYAFTGGEPPTADRLGEVYRQQTSGSPIEGETWHNWIIRLEGVAIGFVQATVDGDGAELAWVVGTPWQGLGYATEAALAMRDWLASHGVVQFSAHIHPEHSSSDAVAARVGLKPSGRLDDEGEMIWT